jgi:hypothetical protein
MGHLFLSYAREDHDAVSKVYGALREAGFDPWMDRPPAPWHTEGIPPGVPWEPYLKTKIENAELVLCFLSSVSVAKTGQVQKELKDAVALVALRPPDRPFLLPIRLDDCPVPNVVVGTIQLRALQWLDLFNYGMNGLLKVLTEMLGKREPDQPRVDPSVAVLRLVLEEETSRFNRRLADKDKHIADLEKDLASARRDIPPPEAWDDPDYMQWWRSHRYDNDENDDHR